MLGWPFVYRFEWNLRSSRSKCTCVPFVIFTHTSWLSFSLSLHSFSFWLVSWRVGPLFSDQGSCHASCSGRWKSNHWTIRDMPPGFFQILSPVPRVFTQAVFLKSSPCFLCFISSHALDLNLEVTSSETFPDFPTRHPHCSFLNNIQYFFCTALL